MKNKTIGDLIIWLIVIQVITYLCYFYNFIESKLLTFLPTILVVLMFVLFYIIGVTYNKYYGKDSTDNNE